LALSDSSLKALQLATDVVGAETHSFQIDLLNLEWTDRWDVAFLLDVLEHIPEDLTVLKEIQRSLRPGGLLFVTTPALQQFWSYNDEAVGHQRRYSRQDFRRLAEQSGLELCDARYFMFFLSGLVLASRWRGPDLKQMSAAEIHALLAKTHRIPAAPVNQLLRMIFSLETPLGLHVPFPWGTSILGVFRRPA
jgi:SAM-dependent methyltransferase